MPEKKIRIALLGPESTGKSTLAEKLAGHYSTMWVHEYSREYLEKEGLHVSINDISKIATETKNRILSAEEKAGKIIFCDTEFIYLKVWSDIRFKSCPKNILQYISEIPFDLFLLTAPDIDWVPDPVRENPNEREKLFELYKKEVAKNGFLYEIVNGTDSQRFKNAMSFLEKHFPLLR